MQVLENKQLLVELNSDEEAQIQGGALPFWAALAAGGAAFQAWLSTPGNGFFVNPDGRRGTADDIYAGKSGWRSGGDIHGWRWGVVQGGNWFLGGYGTKGQWAVDRLRRLVGR